MSQELSGRALDAAVAEKVMGEVQPSGEPMPYSENYRNGFDRYLATGPISSPEGNWLCIYQYENGDVAEWIPRPFSSDWSAMQRVVGRMNELGHRLELFQADKRRWGPDAVTKLIPLPGEMEHEHDAWFALFDNGMGGTPSMGETAPLALCRAALAAVGATI